MSCVFAYLAVRAAHLDDVADGLADVQMAWLIPVVDASQALSYAIVLHALNVLPFLIGGHFVLAGYRRVESAGARVDESSQLSRRRRQAA